MTVKIVGGSPLGYKGHSVKQLSRGSTVVGSVTGKLYMVTQSGLLSLTDGNTLAWGDINNDTYFIEVDLEITIK